MFVEDGTICPLTRKIDKDRARRRFNPDLISRARGAIYNFARDIYRAVEWKDRAM